MADVPGPKGSGLPVEEMSAPRIQEFVASLSARRAPATTRHAHRVLSLILDQAVAERRLAIPRTVSVCRRCRPSSATTSSLSIRSRPWPGPFAIRTRSCVSRPTEGSAEASGSD